MSSLQHSHDPESIRRRLFSPPGPNYLRDFIYGSIDGTITTFAIVAGVVGAGMSNQTIIILGFANILADGFSMAASNYLGTKSEADEVEKIKAFEMDQLKRFPEGERAEVREIFRQKGFSGEILENIVNTISKNEKEWLKIMLQEEYGVAPISRKPLLSGLTTFVAFILFGLFPLIPFLFETDSAFAYACAIAGVCFFIVGALKSKWSMEPFLSAGIKTLLIGVVASLIAYYTGSFLEGVMRPE